MPLIWRAIYVKSRTEKKVGELLSQKGIEAYVPLVKTVRQWSDRKKAVQLPLFNGYVFVHIANADHENVLKTRGVVNYVRYNGEVARIRDEEIDRMKQLVELGYHLESCAIGRNVRSGEKVTIGSGALKGLEGIVVEDKDQQQLLIVLESIGQCIRVRLPREVVSLKH